MLKGLWYRLTVVLLVSVVFVSCTPKAIPVGFIGGLSGFNADLGISGRNGVSLAIDAINRAGGIRGRKLELLVRDDKQDPDTARRVFQELVSKKVVVVIGPMTSAIAQVLNPLANEEQVLLISPTASSPDFSGLDDMFVRLTPPNTEEALGLAQESFRQGGRRVCIVNDLSNKAFSGTIERTYTAELRGLAEAEGIEVSIISLPFDPDDPKGAPILLTGLARYMPDLLLFTTNSHDTAILAQQIRKKGFSVPFLGTGWAMSEILLENGGDAVDGMVFAVPFNPNSDREDWKQFASLYQNTFGKPADFGAHQAWNAVQVLKEALASGDRKHIKKRIINRHYEGLQGTFFIDTFGDPRSSFQRVQVRSGQFITVTDR